MTIPSSLMSHVFTKSSPPSAMRRRAFVLLGAADSPPPSDIRDVMAGRRPQRQRQKAPAAPGPESALRGKPLYPDSDQALADSDGDRMQPVLRTQLPLGAEEQCFDLFFVDADSPSDVLSTVAIGRQSQADQFHPCEEETLDISSLLKSALTH